MSDEKPVVIRLTRDVFDLRAGATFVARSAAAAKELYGTAHTVLRYEDGSDFVRARDASLLALKEQRDAERAAQEIAEVAGKPAEAPKVAKALRDTSEKDS